MDRPMSDLEEILSALYESEINTSISCGCGMAELTCSSAMS
jgi:hypothetical protein